MPFRSTAYSKLKTHLSLEIARATTSSCDEPFLEVPTQPLTRSVTYFSPGLGPCSTHFTGTQSGHASV